MIGVQRFPLVDNISTAGIINTRRLKFHRIAGEVCTPVARQHKGLIADKGLQRGRDRSRGRGRWQGRGRWLVGTGCRWGLVVDTGCWLDM